MRSVPFTLSGEWIPEPSKTIQKPIKIIKEKRRGAFVTLILNLSPEKHDLKKICSTIKQRYGCGGSVKNETIELQGDQLASAKLYLQELGIKTPK